MKKKLLLSLVAVLMFAGVLHAAGASSPITGFSWDNVRKVVRMMTSDGQEIQVSEAPKQYEVGKTYNGVTLNVTGFTGGSVTRGVFIPYRTSDGTWRLKFNITGLFGSSSTSMTLSVVGITTPSSVRQACAGFGNIGTSGGICYMNSNNSTIDMSWGTASTQAGVFGDVELASKPTWAD